MTDEIDVLRTITIWREHGVTPAQAYEGLGERIPAFDLAWADVQAMALAKRREAPDHEPPAGANIIALLKRAA